MSADIDTIVAIATPPGRGGIGIVRLSGTKAKTIAASILQEIPLAKTAEYSSFLDAKGNVIDKGIALFFPNPLSFTGEDVFEFHCHGGPVVLDMLLERSLELGARQARAGEFSERAFLNGKIDLTQAEAIADLIDASSRQAAQAAINSLQGTFSKKINVLLDKLIDLRAHVESAIDFPEEEIDFLSAGDVANKLEELLLEIDGVLAEEQQGRLLQEGMSIVIIGQPNVGKSSLLNLLSGYESAIVTDTPGTTRDVLREKITLDGMPLHIIDTAGLRHGGDDVEKEGLRKAHLEIEKADHVLLVTDIQKQETTNLEGFAENIKEKHITIILNKVDLTKLTPEIQTEENKTIISMSAKTGEGLDLLCEHLKKSVGYNATCEGKFLARRRHLDAINKAKEALLSGQNLLQQKDVAIELFSEELRQAQLALSAVTGAFVPEDLLDTIFSSFCIGK